MKIIKRETSVNCFKLLIEKINNKQYVKKFIKEFDFLEKLQCWYYEVFLIKNKNPTYNDILDTLRILLKNSASELNFHIVKD